MEVLTGMFTENMAETAAEVLAESTQIRAQLRAHRPVVLHLVKAETAAELTTTKTLISTSCPVVGAVAGMEAMVLVLGNTAEVAVQAIAAHARQHILVCSHFPSKYLYNEGKYIFAETENIYLSSPLTADYGLDGWKAYLAAQYAAGTPVQLCYKLAEPVSFTATGTQPIPALSGVNTLYTDAGTLTVTGREDPRHTIVTLTDRIAALESAAACV